MAKLPSKAYLLQSRGLLANFFPNISDAAIEHIFNDRSNLDFTEAFRQLKEIDSNPDVIEGVPRIQVLRKHPRRTKKVSVTDEHLTDEISLIPELIQKPASRPKEVIVLSDSEDEEDDRKPSARIFKDGARKQYAAAVSNEVIELLDSDVEEEEEKKDDLTECKVCYGDYESSEIHNCGQNEDHAVCKTCISRFVSEQLHGNGSLKFTCIGDVGCSCEYSLALLEKVLPEDLNKQVTERTFHEFTEIEGMWKCPAGCGHIGFIEQNFPWIVCPNCDRQYCTKCNEIVHYGKTCEEIRMEKAQSKDPKHRAHEAMSLACKRFCPHCNQEFMKSDGCNKITCSKCKLKSCYICGDKIADYSHFCNHRRNDNVCPCGKLCQLWTSTDEMEKVDRNKRQEAGRKVLVEAGYTDEKEILFILGSPEKIKISTGRPSQQPVPPAGGFIFGAPPLQNANPARAGFRFANDPPPQQNANPVAAAGLFGAAPQNQVPVAQGFRFDNNGPPQNNANPAAVADAFRGYDAMRRVNAQLEDLIRRLQDGDAAPR
ncbi:hypothetical protein ACHAXN_005771 [Cyclotella atomus]